MGKIIVVGGGPAGMMAAIRAAENGAEVLLLEKMPRLGKKLSLTGKGRCNITNAAELDEIIANIPGNGKFLYSSLSAFTNQELMDFFQNNDVPVKIERGKRVFPVSDKAQDVVDALQDKMLYLGVQVVRGEDVVSITAEDGYAKGVQTRENHFYTADAIILATGGASYPGTGSSGDGYSLAESVGHMIISPLPSLVPLETEEDWVKDAQGVSLRNVRASLYSNGQNVQGQFGEMIFTHFGVSGPVILSLSRMAVQLLNKGNMVELSLDLKPALSEEVLYNRLQRDWDKYSKKQAGNALHDLLPSKIIRPVLDAAYIDIHTVVNQITREQRLRLVRAMKNLLLTITSARPIAEAIVTAGGVSTNEISPKTMESRLINGLYFAGEVVDIDGFTGGYNLQAAFSMGAAAGYWSSQIR